MEYPIWELSTFGGGFLIALIATIHVFIAHFAVGGGPFMVLAERKAIREGSAAVEEYVAKHAKFFLYLSMVAGALTGVGIWFTVSVMSPRATGILISNFVFVWAIEWVFFACEIAALLLYVKRRDKLDAEKKMMLLWMYAGFAWASLFLINGIVSFMLTPGRWIETGNLMHAFFNPTFWPTLVVRTGIAVLLAGIFGVVTSFRVKDEKASAGMRAFSAKFVLFSLPFIAGGIAWCCNNLNTETFAFLEHFSNSKAVHILFAALTTMAVASAYLYFFSSKRGALHVSLAAVLVVSGFGFMGSFEYLRERLRRPYVIKDVVYSNGVLKQDAESVREEGMLAASVWGGMQGEMSDIAKGKKVYQMACGSCHSIEGVMNDIVKRTEHFPPYGMEVFINGIGKVSEYMPQFMGTDEERRLLAEYLTYHINGSSAPVLADSPEPLPVPEEAFDREKDEYVLLSWNNLGMHCISDADNYWVLLPPANDLYAQLIKRGDKPEVLSEGIVISYEVEEGFKRPYEHSDFWKNAKSLFGAEPAEGIGLAGKGVDGEMDRHDNGLFEAKLIPVMPYTDDGYNPFPLFTITARDEKTNEVLAKTKVVAPTSTEMGCKNCHGGPWKVDNRAGISDKAAANVLEVHDRKHGTDLLAKAESGSPQLCQGCHPDPVLGSEGDGKRLNLPAAIHGFHANFVAGYGNRACNSCHPNDPKGATLCQRGFHRDDNIHCTTCHGTIEDHAASLLLKEKELGKERADKLLKNIKTRTVASLEDVNPRTPWLNEPDCLNCHKGFQTPESKNMSAFNTWTSGPEELYRVRFDETGKLSCEGCHGSPHANYPTKNIYGENRDNIQPLQYQGKAASIGKDACWVCHTGKMPEKSKHHPNMIKKVAEK